VTHNRENFDVAETQPGCPCWHDSGRACDVRTTNAVGIARDLNAGSDVGLGAEFHPAQLIFDMREREQHGTVLERVTDAAFTAATVAARALVVRGRACPERA